MTSHLELLRARDIRLKASIGQNLLMDANLCEKIVREARLEPGDAVLEIGPGTGALTEKLLETRARVLAVETDGRLIPLLAERFGSDENFRLVHQDFLRFPREALDEWRAGRSVTVVANLPYYNSSQIIFRLLEWRDALLSAILTLQLELAERVAAPPGGKDYGILSVRVQALTAAHRLFNLPAHVFFPKPNVESAVLRLDFSRRSLPDDLDETQFAKCVKTAFGARRKTLANALSQTYERGDVLAALAACGIDPIRRAETLALAEFFHLSSALGTSRDRGQHLANSGAGGDES